MSANVSVREGYSMTKACKIAGLSRHKLYIALFSGELEAIPIRPNLIIITKRSLDAHINKNNL